MPVPWGKTRAIDCDTHFWQPLELWEPYIDRKYRGQVVDFMTAGEAPQREIAAKVTADASGSKYSSIRGGDYPKERLQWMDEEGLDVNIIYPGAGRAAMVSEPEAAAAACRALNRWEAAFAAAAPDRLKPCMILPMRYPDKALQELRYASNTLGLKVAFVAPTPPPERRWSDPALDPVWAEMQEAEVVLTFHEFTQLAKGYPGVARDTYRDSYPFMYFCGHVMEMQLALMDVIGGGVLERFPRLKVGFVEAGVAWLPGWLALMDSMWSWLSSHKRAPKGGRAMSLHPTEFFRRQCFIEAFPDDAWIPEVISYVGEDNIVLCTDYPHPGTSYQMIETFSKSYPTLADGVRRKILGENADRIFGLQPSR